LLELLVDATRRPVTLVVAPAGTGKTSLVSGWAADSPTPTAWVSLDDTDRHLVQFWSAVIAALESLLPGCGEHALPLFRRPGGRASAVDRLLADLDVDAPPSGVLIVDDFHLVDVDAGVVDSVATFVRDLPKWLHVVLMSRRAPALPVDRMRSRGQLSEVHFAELRFSRDEAITLMSRLSPTLSSERVEAAVHRADGWAASLQLAALEARSNQARAIEPGPVDVDDALVQDYVLREVLAGEAPEVVDVLSAAAAVPRINTSLAGAMTDRPDAGALLRTAADRGLFLTRRGSDGWFELHALVAAVLTSDMDVEAPARLAELHRRAARWFEETGDAVVALDQWRLADRPRDVLRVLAANHGPLYDSGREGIVKRAIAAIPASVAFNELEAMVDYAWCHLLVDRRRFIELVDQLTRSVERVPPDDVVRSRADVLRASADVIRGCWVGSGAADRRAMATLGDACWRDPIGRFAANGIGRELAYSEQWDDTSDEVRRLESTLVSDPDRRLAFEGIRAVGAAFAGRPLDAVRFAAGVRNAALVADMTIMRTELALAEALAHRELGDHARSRVELAAVADPPPEGASDTMLFCRVLAACELAEAHLDVGDVEAARGVLAGVEATIESESLGVDAWSRAARAAAVVALADNDVDAARRAAELVVDPFWAPITVARISLATGAPGDASEVLQGAVPRCVRHEVVLALLTARAATDRAHAMERATVAVELAGHHGLLQTVASDGADIMDLLERAAWRAPADWLDRLRRATAEASDRGAPSGAQLIEPLTERERDVLRFLPSRLTTREIADELYVSVNTLKFHLRVIYRKLGVNSRAEAARIARTMTSLR
jgi:LuxR family maltose regulon positive regulatory protein